MTQQEEELVNKIDEAVEQATAITPQQALYDQMNDPEVAAGLIASARNLNDKFRGNWFTLSQIIKKTNIKHYGDARQLMNMLLLKGLAKTEEMKGEQKFQIAFTKENQIKLLKEQVLQLEEQLGLVKATIATLEGNA